MSINKKNPKIKENGCSKYLRSRIEKPECLHFVPRNYAQYGISEDEFIERLKAAPPPDGVLGSLCLRDQLEPDIYTIIVTLKGGKPFVAQEGIVYADILKYPENTLLGTLTFDTSKEFDTQRAVINWPGGDDLRLRFRFSHGPNVPSNFGVCGFRVVKGREGVIVSYR